jgi:hypothetical protein
MTFRQAMMISIVLLAWLAFSPAFTANFKGVPRIVDGDTLVIGSMKFSTGSMLPKLTKCV